MAPHVYSFITSGDYSKEVSGFILAGLSGLITHRGSQTCERAVIIFRATFALSSMLDSVVFNEAGLVPAIAQDAASGEVLMVAWMNREALAETASTGHAVYFSRSRQRLWRKGESSGHVQKVREMRLDCDGDAILIKVEQRGGIACHTGRRHCFWRELNDGVWETVEPMLKSPSEIYGDKKMS